MCPSMSSSSTIFGILVPLSIAWMKAIIFSILRLDNDHIKQSSHPLIPLIKLPLQIVQADSKQVLDVLVGSILTLYEYSVWVSAPAFDFWSACLPSDCSPDAFLCKQHTVSVFWHGEGILHHMKVWHIDWTPWAMVSLVQSSGRAGRSLYHKVCINLCEQQCIQENRVLQGSVLNATLFAVTISSTCCLSWEVLINLSAVFRLLMCICYRLFAKR